jgi:hypothetical protein
MGSTPLKSASGRPSSRDGASVFNTTTARQQRDQEALQGELYEQIGRLKMELEWLKKGCLWQLSNTLDGRFCLDALDLALEQGRPKSLTRTKACSSRH